MKNLTSAFIFVLATLLPSLALGNGAAVNPIIAKGGCAYNLFTQACIAGGGAGTVTSVGLSLTGPLFTVSGSPVVGIGTLTGTLNTQAAHTLFIGPAAGGAVAPTFRLLVASDLPDISGTYEVVANKDTDGTLAANSDVKYASQKATKTYVDTGLATKQNSLGYTAEDVANKDTDSTMAANSDVKYPSQKAVKTALATKEPTITAGTNLQYYRGDKSFQTLDTLACVENTNLYFTQARVLSTPITGFVSGAGAVAATDTILQALNKLDGNVATKQATIATDAGTAHQFFNSYAAGVFGKAAIGLSDLPSIQYPQQFWVDGQLGSDANDGSYQHPWQTLTHACASIAPIIPDPTLLNLTGASDSSAGAITCPANIILSAHDPQYQITQSVTITGTIGNDTIGAINVTFLGGLNFIKNTATVDSIFLNNVDVISGPVLKQNGAGGFIIFANNLVANALDIKPGPSGIAIFNSPYFTGTTTFEDATNASYYQFQGGYIDSAMSIAGGPFVYFSGLMFDTPGGATLTTSATANGSPTIQSDDSSIPGSITGPNTLVLQSHSQHTEYTPTTAADWSVAPATVLAGLDKLASTGVFKSQAANKFFASPNGAPGLMSPRSIVAADVPILNQNTTGTAANLSGTPALPNGTTATTQAPGDNSTKLATTAYADAAAAGGGISSLTTDVVAAGPGAAVATIQPGVVTNAKMANMAASTIKGNNTGGALAPIDLSVAQVKALLAYAFSDLSGSATQAQLPNMVTITKVANYTLLTTDTNVDGNGTFNFTLPVATSTLKQPYVISNIGAGVLTVLPNGADTIISIASITINPGQSATLSPDGVSNWKVQ